MEAVLYRSPKPKKTVTKTRPKGWGPPPTEAEIKAHEVQHPDADGDACWLTRENDQTGFDVTWWPNLNDGDEFKAVDPNGDAVEIVYEVEIPEKVRPKGWGPAPTQKERAAHAAAHPNCAGNGVWLERDTRPGRHSVGSVNHNADCPDYILRQDYQYKAIDMNGDDVEVRYTEEV